MTDNRDEEEPDGQVARRLLRFFSAHPGKPFFIAAGFHKPHMPWHVPRKWFDLFPLESIKLPPYLENDLDDLPPAAVRMAHPETDHVPMQKSGRWKEAIQAYLATIALPNLATPNNGDNWVTQVKIPVDWREENIRGDWNITNKNFRRIFNVIMVVP